MARPGEQRGAMRQLLIAGNWKMNCTVEAAVQLATSLRECLGPVAGVEIVVCPPFVALQSVSSVLAETRVRVGAQNVFFEDAGAFTGEVSPLMLADLCHYVIVGHSERRKWFGESDELVGRKVAALRRHGLVPILCVGESLQENTAGHTEEVLARQLRGALESSAPTKELVVAYEPIWAIGTGKPALPDDVNNTARAIRDMIGQIWDMASARELRILYGGSVASDNVAEFVSLSDIDGALVGGASLRAPEFAEIVFRTASVQKKRSCE